MAEVYRSSVFAVKEETTEGALIAEVAADFMPIRDGFSFQGNLEVVNSDELIDDIAPGKSFTAKEAPVGSLPKYLRHSGTEGTAPEFSVMIKSAIGGQTDNSTEYSTSGTSVAGTATVRGHLEMGSDQEDNFLEGQAVLIKNAAAGVPYEIRNVYNVDSPGNQLDLNFNVGTAPATGTALGKAIHFRPAGTGHVSYSAYHYQASASSAFKQAMAGCRTTNMVFNFPANGLAEVNFDFEGIQFYFNPLTVTASSNDYIDFTDDAGTYAARLTAKVYNNPHELAREIESKMDDLASDEITVTYSDSTGKFTIASDGGVTFSLLWNTGTNTANTAGALFGFTVSADDTGAFTYTSDSALDYSPSVTPSYDTQDSIMVKNSELLIGGFADTTCRIASQATFTVSTPKTDILDVCSASGINSSIINSREVTFSAVVLFVQHDIGLIDKFINNTTASVMFNTGEKTGSDWDAGTCVNIYMNNATITAHPITNQDGYVAYNLEAKGFVSDTRKDVHINFL
jgi:hypothetical protein